VQETETEVRGVQAAKERYGEPLVWQRTLEVSAETVEYWRNLADRRVAEVVLLVRRPDGRLLLHTKAFYPPGAYRLMSGGIHPGEDVAEAALREAAEETGLQVRIERFVGILRQRFVHEGEEAAFTSCLFLLAEEGGKLGNHDADEEITDYREIAPEELPAVAEALEALPPDWADWGRFRAAAHRMAACALLGDALS
jgi:8-oxo-dGTP pyrophosphatase MutT (NUDIX family)